MNHPERKNELSPELLAVHALNFATANNAPARGVMFAGHFAQRPVIDGSEPNLIQTGVEEEFGQYTFKAKMPEDGTILQVIPRYPEHMGEDVIQFNPETLVIYRDNNTGIIDFFTIPYHSSHHPTFGFRFEQKEALGKLAVGREFPKDTVFADSPAVHGESNYTYGKNLNVIYMSHPNVGLDGYVISRDALKHFQFKIYETRSVEFGANEFPLNLYGDDLHYKPFPEIGEAIREDGLLMALRRFDANLAPAMVSRKDLQEIDYLFDNKTYARPGKGKIVDLTVIRSENVNRQLPPEMTVTLNKYAKALLRFHKEIVAFEERMVIDSKKRGGEGEIFIHPRLQRLIVESKAMIDYDHSRFRQGLTLAYRKEPLDGWRVNFTIEYDVVPDRGFKLTCCNGGKGVICRIEEPENMPIDEDGNRADIISGPDSIPGRMNLGRLYAPYFNAAARDVKKMVLEAFGYDRNFKGKVSIEQVSAIPKEKYDLGVSIMLKFYNIISERQYREFTENLNEEEQLHWVMLYINEPPYLYIPVDSEKLLDEVVVEIEKNFKLVYGPVSYVGRSGQKVTTKNKFRIAPLYMMLLDKIADAWLSVDIGKHSNFGILAAMNRMDKHSTPWRRTPPRLFGETESQLYCCYGGREMIAELLDRSGNITSQKEIAKKILHEPNPTNIEELLDRDKIPLGNARPIQITQHLFNCAGFRVKYGEEK